MICAVWLVLLAIPGLISPMEGETPLHKITISHSWLKRLIPSLSWLVYIGDHDSSILSIGDNPAYNNQSNPMVGCIFSSFKFIFTAADHQGNDLSKTRRSEME